MLYCSIALLLLLSAPDCAVLAARVQFIFDNLLWVLTLTQMEAFIFFLRSLYDLIRRSQSHARQRHLENDLMLFDAPSTRPSPFLHPRAPQSVPNFHPTPNPNPNPNPNPAGPTRRSTQPNLSASAKQVPQSCSNPSPTPNPSASAQCTAKPPRPTQLPASSQPQIANNSNSNLSSNLPYDLPQVRILRQFPAPHPHLNNSSQCLDDLPKIFDKFDIFESSFHLYIRNVDLHLCEEGNQGVLIPAFRCT